MVQHVHHTKVAGMHGQRAVLRVTSTSDTYRKPATLTDSRNSGAGACDTASSECSSSPGDVTGATRSGSATGSAPATHGHIHVYPGAAIFPKARYHRHECKRLLLVTSDSTTG